MTNESPNAQQSRARSVINLIATNIVNDSPFSDQSIDPYDASQTTTPENVVWTTSLLSQVRNLCFSLDQYMKGQYSSVGKVISNAFDGLQNIVDRQRVVENMLLK